MTEHYLDRLARTINENRDQPALTDFYLTEDGSAQDTSRGNHYTYGEMYREILRLHELFHALGLQTGDHIAICAANSAHWAIAYLAIAAYQGVAVTVLHSQAIEDIARQIDFSDAKALFTDLNLWHELKDLSLPQIEHVISLDNWQILHGEEAKSSILNLPSSIRQARFSHGNPDDLAMICFTSGSTGSPKGVMLSYRNLSNNVHTSLILYPKEKNPSYLSIMPYDHLAGLMGDILSQLVNRKSVWVFREEWGGKNILRALQITTPYMVITIPYLLDKNYNALSDSILCSLQSYCKLICIGGAPPSRETEKQLIQSGIPLAVAYGQTEAAPEISLPPYGQYRPHSSGKIVEGMIARIAPNGEILVKGENVMLGYYKNPEATAQKIDKDGWLHTGDRGHLDEDGYLYVEGRLEQDMIVLPNGENIHPEDIERKINALPEVKESIVLARDGKLVAIVVANTDIRRHILRTVNPDLPLYSQLCDVEITDTPLAKTEKQTLKRYLYK